MGRTDSWDSPAEAYVDDAAPAAAAAADDGGANGRPCPQIRECVASPPGKRPTGHHPPIRHPLMEAPCPPLRRPVRAPAADNGS